MKKQNIPIKPLIKNKKQVEQEFLNRAAQTDTETPKIKDEDGKNLTVKDLKKHAGIGWWGKRKLKRHPDSTFIVTMFMSNNSVKHWVIKTSEEWFEYRKRRYHLRFQDSYYSITNKEYILFYHEDEFEPIRIQELTKAVNSDDFHPSMPQSKAWWHVKPHNAKEIFEMEYYRVLATAVELTKWIKFVLLLSIVNFFGLVLLIYMVYQMTRTTG